MASRARRRRSGVGGALDVPPVDTGRTAAHNRRRGTPWLVEGGRRGGHGEGLRRTHGEAAGAKLGTSAAERSVVNVGTTPHPARIRPASPGPGRARRRPG